ncbi:MAG TPA: type IV pilus modification protein PilV [Telluria sp.]|nr:type IV pilus modification protein PilV [Telluria sp.]
MRFAGGFTLLEVLVAVFVLAVGALGAAATQLTALRTRHQSSLMSSGVQLAGSLADSMRANLETMRAADSANPYLQLNYDAGAAAPQPPATSCFAGAGCSAAQLADADLYQLKRALHDGFPGGRVLVCRDSQPRDGALSWACAGAASAAIVIKLGWREGAGDVAPSVAIALPGAIE